MNATAKILPVGNDTAEPTDAVADLLAERSRIVAELERLRAIDGPVREAEAAVAAVDRAISTLDQAERARTEDWAASGVGDPPSPRNAERAGLVRRRLELQSDVEGARNRATAVAPRRTALNGELRRIDHQLFAEKLRSAIEEARRLDAHAHELALEMREPIGKVAALKFALMQHRSQVGGNAPAERLIGEAIDALAKFKMPEIGGDPSAINGFIEQWRDALR
jgi:hypothetical protein